VKHTVIDGFCFQSGDAAAGAAVVALVPKLEAEGVEVTFLDRGDASTISCSRIIPFPAWTGAASAADAFLVQAVCDEFGADVVLTTGVASAVRTPSVLLTSGFFTANIHSARHARLRAERELAILHARRIICPSASAYDEMILEFEVAGWEEELATRIEFDPEGETSTILTAALRQAALAPTTRIYRDFARDWVSLRAIQSAVDLDVYADA